MLCEDIRTLADASYKNLCGECVSLQQLATTLTNTYFLPTLVRPLSSRLIGMFFPQLFARDGNAALDLNPPNAQEHISAHASDWLWAAFSLITLCLLGITGLTFLVSTNDVLPLHSQLRQCTPEAPR